MTANGLTTLCSPSVTSPEKADVGDQPGPAPDLHIGPDDAIGADLDVLSPSSARGSTQAVSAMRVAMSEWFLNP